MTTPGEQLPYLLVDAEGTPVEAVRDYLIELLASDCSPLTAKSYAFDLLDWFRFLARIGVTWDQADRRMSAIGCWKPGPKSTLNAATALTVRSPAV